MSAAMKFEIAKLTQGPGCSSLKFLALISTTKLGGKLLYGGLSLAVMLTMSFSITQRNSLVALASSRLANGNGITSAAHILCGFTGPQMNLKRWLRRI